MNGANHGGIPGVPTVSRGIARDKEVVSATQGGSSGALGELYAAYSRRLFQTIIAITKNREDAEDALQDTFVRAYLALHSFEGRSSVYSWLTRIAVNSALQILRKKRARPEILFDPHPDGQAEALGFEVQDSALTPERAYELRHRRMTLSRAICSLDARLRRPILLWISSESSVKEISQELKISEAAVKTRLHRARRRLSAACRES